ncbi:MAG: zinc ribbon domain-containing protein [Clostridiaceae bacterium]|jgi:hypothetical protein|nr:zinc ribbon domain-containing protein [Clostridiaceae bacterium]
MYCAKCGNQSAEGAKFCKSCGAAMPQGEAGVTQSSGNAPQGVEGAPQTAGGSARGMGEASSASKKGSKKLITIVSVVAAVLLAVILMIGNLWAISPKTFYGYLESHNKPIGLNDSYKQVMKASDLKPFSKNIGISVSEIGGLDITNAMLKDFEIQAQVDYSSGKSTLYASGKYLNNLLADVILYQDKSIIGIGSPALYDRSFTVNKKEIYKAINNLNGYDLDYEPDFKLKTIEEITGKLDRDTKLADKAISKYSKIVYKNIPSERISITKPDDPASVYTWQSGKARSALKLDKYKRVEIKLAEKDIYAIFDKVIEVLRDDDELLNMVIDYSFSGNSSSPVMNLMRSYEIDKDERAELLKELKSELDNTRENLIFDDEGEKTLITMAIITDNKNHIVSREITTEDSVITMMDYVADDKMEVTEINMSEGRFGTGDQLANLYVYKGEKGKGVKFLTQYDGTIELSYKPGGKGKNSLGLEYGDYSASVLAGYESYALKLSTDKEDSVKGTDVLDLTIQQNGNDLIECELSVSELKNKSKLKFNKDRSIDLATTEADELQEIFWDIEEQLESMSRELGRMMYDR